MYLEGCAASDRVEEEQHGNSLIDKHVEQLSAVVQFAVLITYILGL